MRARPNFPVAVLLLVLLLVGGLGADSPERALHEVEVATELRQAQLKALHLEMARLSDPALGLAQAVRFITDWGGEADDPEPAISALQTIASAAKGTPLRRLTLFHLARLMAEKERPEEAVEILTTLAVEAAGEAREGSRQAREKEERRLRQWEAELDARSQRLAEQSERLKEYAKQIKAEQARLERAERSDPKHHPEAEHPREAAQPHSEDR